MVYFIPLSGLPSADTLATFFIQHVVRLHGIPENIASDRGSQFVARFWKAFCANLGMSPNFSTGYQLQSNSQTEGVNQKLEQYLRCYESHDDWSQFLPWAEFAYNNSNHASSDMSPFFCNYRFHCKAASFVANLAVESHLLKQRVRARKSVWNKVHRALGTAALSAKRKVDVHCRPQTFKVGGKVWLSTKNIRLRQPCGTLGPGFIGPFTILRQINLVACLLDLPRSMRIPKTFYCSLFKPVSPFRNYVRRPPAFLVQGQENPWFYVAWQAAPWSCGLLDYGPEERSWEPARNIHADCLVQAFHAANSDKPFRDCGGRECYELQRPRCNLWFPMLLRLRHLLSTCLMRSQVWSAGWSLRRWYVLGMSGWLLAFL